MTCSEDLISSQLNRLSRKTLNIFKSKMTLNSLFFNSDLI